MACQCVCQWGWCIAPGTHRSIQSGSKRAQLPLRSFAFKSVLFDIFDWVWLSNCERFSSEQCFYFRLLSALLHLFVCDERERWFECAERDRRWGRLQQITTNDVSCHCAVSVPCLSAWWIMAECCEPVSNCLRLSTRIFSCWLPAAPPVVIVVFEGRIGKKKESASVERRCRRKCV